MQQCHVVFFDRSTGLQEVKSRDYLLPAKVFKCPPLLNDKVWKPKLCVI